MADEKIIRFAVHICAGCSKPYIPGSPTAKNCPSCSLLARIAYARSKKATRRECGTCAAVFAPLHIQDNRRCAACTIRQNPETLARVDCAMCKATAPGQDARVRICLVCAKDREGRKDLLTRLQAGQEQRRHAFSTEAKQTAELVTLWHQVIAPDAPAPSAEEERTWTLQRRKYTLDQLREIETSPSKSASTKQQARDILASLP